MLWSFSFSVFAQVNYTANDQVTPYTGLFRPGINFDYYPPYTGKDLANIAAGNPALNLPGIGARTSRPALFEKFAENWGYDYLLSDFQHFQSLGMEDLTMIVGFPAEWHRDQTYYCDGADPMHVFCGNDPYNQDCKSNMFANLYTPIWDGGANGTPYNDNNYLAAYMYKLVTNYKDYVKFWEVWNEPGFDHSFVQGWQQPGGPNNWWDNDPSPCVNHFHAPIEHYVRTLRICYDVVKTVDPDAYVAIAGVGFESFLDAILRNTDNPVDGSVTAEYPNGGGAYFDVMGFHTYPDIDGSVRDLVNGQWVYTRNSDKAAQGVPKRKNAYQALLAQYGYDGVIHPKKEWIITEINTPRVPFYASNPNSMASDESQTNYITKAVVAAMKNDIRQIHPYQLADRKTVADATDEFDLLGMYYNFTNTQPYTNLTKTHEGIAYTTTSKFIFGSTYDANKTAAMNLPSSIDGGAFYDATNNRYKYIIWAKATLDLSEAASANYSFPSSFGLTTINKRLWDWSETGTTTDVSPNNIALTARPIYLTDAPDPGKGNLVLTCPDDIHVNLPQGAGNVVVTWNDATAITTCPTSSTASVSQTAGMTSGSDFWMGMHTISYGAFDQCANTANCSFDIIVSQSTNSTINTICPADISVTAASGANTATASWTHPTATTTCSASVNVTITQTSGGPSGGNFTIGSHDIVYTFTDQCGTSTTCSFTVTVNPSSTASCGNISGFTKLGEYNGHGYYISTADWNWQDGSSFASQSGGYLATINDAAENNYLQSILSEMAFIGLYDLNVEGTVEWDNGEPVSYTNYSTSCPWCHANGPEFDFAVMLPWDGSWVFENQWVNRPIVMELDCGGTPAGDLTITSCPSNIVQTLATGTSQMAISWPTPTATTTCSTAMDITVSQTTGPSSGSNFDAGTYNISYTLSDQCNNSANCSFSVTVNTSSTGGTCDAIPGFTKLGELNGKGYYISDLEMTWGNASTVASANGGSIASISSQEENDFIANLISDIVFIGFSDAATEGTVVWDNGDALSYTNYSTCDWCGLNTAENDYGVMLPWNGEWSFNNQWVHRKFILETTCGGGTGTSCPPTIAGYTNLGDFNGHNYYLSDNPLNWAAANTAATDAGGYLATMNDQAENDFLQSNLGNQLVFIGYNDAASEGSGAWANGETVSLDLSYSNDIDKDYGIMNFWAGTWQMVNQWVAKPYVVEMNCAGAAPAPIAPQLAQMAPGVKLVAMYPNPADDFITARMTSGSDVEVTFTIISAQGQAKAMTIDQLTKGPNEVNFDIQDLQPGMYFLKATGKNVNQVIRFVKMN